MQKASSSNYLFTYKSTVAAPSFKEDGMRKSAGARMKRLNVMGLDTRFAVATLSGPFKDLRAKLSGRRCFKAKVDGKTAYVNYNSASKRLHMTALKTLESDEKIAGRSISDRLGAKLQDAFAAVKDSKLDLALSEYQYHYKGDHDAQLQGIGWNSKVLLKTVKMAMAGELKEKEPTLIRVEGKSMDRDMRALVQKQSSQARADRNKLTIHAIATKPLGYGSFGIASKALDTFGRQMKCVKESKDRWDRELFPQLKIMEPELVAGYDKALASDAKNDLENEDERLKELNKNGSQRGIQEGYDLVLSIRSGQGAIGLTKLYDGDAMALLYTRRKYSAYTQSERQSLVGDLYCGLRVLNEKKWVHADLKPENLFVSKALGERSQLRIADFGGVRDLSDLAIQKSIGTASPRYTAARDYELLGIGEAAEILQAHVVFSSALVAYELLVGVAPDLDDAPGAGTGVLGLQGENDEKIPKMLKELSRKGGLEKSQAALLIRAMSDDYRKRPAMEGLVRAFNRDG